MKINVSSRELTTFGLGVGVSELHLPQSIQELSMLLREFHSQQRTPRFLGAGSNLIFPDESVLEPVIKLGSELAAAFSTDSPITELSDLAMRIQANEGLKLSGEQALVLALGGAPLMGLSRKVSQLGYSGLEFAAGIPASVGGAVKMNAGAHGSCIGDVTEQVITLDGLGQLKSYRRDELPFTYRYSGVPEGEIVIGGLFKLTKGDSASILSKRQSCLDYRKQTQPLTRPSAGSVFRNPTAERAAGAILEELGFKGLTRGGVQFSPLHANWLVRISDSARAEDAVNLIHEAQNKVFTELKIQLTPEIVLW